MRVCQLLSLVAFWFTSKINLIICSPVPASEAEEEKIEVFSGNLYEEYHEPHYTTKFDAATMILLMINLLHDYHSVDSLLLAFLAENT